MDKSETRSDGFKIPSLIFLVLDLFGCILAAFLWGPIHGKFFAIFNEIKDTSSISYSPLVKIMLAIHPIPVLIGFLVLAVALIIKEIIIKKKVITFIINILVGIGLVILFPLAIWTSLVSISQLMDKLQK